MKYVTNAAYQAAQYPQAWQKINSIIGHEEHPANRQHWPPYKGIDTRSNYLNIFLSHVEQGKVSYPEEIEWFIETGTHMGATAMHFATIMERVHTIEKYGTKITHLGEPLPENHYEHMVQQFPNIKMIWGDSEQCLAQVFREDPEFRHQRAVILLDAHNGTTEVPLLAELEAIRQNSAVQNHFIMIDDGADCGKDNFPPFEAVQDLLWQINPKFNVELTDHCRNIIVAY